MKCSEVRCPDLSDRFKVHWYDIIFLFGQSASSADLVMKSKFIICGNSCRLPKTSGSRVTGSPKSSYQIKGHQLISGQVKLFSQSSTVAQRFKIFQNRCPLICCKVGRSELKRVHQSVLLMSKGKCYISDSSIHSQSERMKTKSLFSITELSIIC